jgi:hypothetical protein
MSTNHDLVAHFRKSAIAAFVVLFLVVVLAVIAITSTPSRKRRSGEVFLFHRNLLIKGAPTVSPTLVKDYRLWDAQEIQETLHQWARNYSDFVSLTTAQEAYGLPPTGGEDDCPFDEDTAGCLMYILTLQDYIVHPEGSESSKRLPEVILNGEVHGNERVGPTAVMEATQLLLSAAACEASPRESLRENVSLEEWEREVAFAENCRDDLVKRGIDDADRRWLARLVTTRRIVILPTSNALGYYRSVREENGIDVNRDFPYDHINPTQCMRTITARGINELFREHMFQMGLVFHGGIEVLAYEWGCFSYLGSPSPDDFSQDDITEAHSRYGGGWSGTSPYIYGRMDETVYAVRG